MSAVVVGNMLAQPQGEPVAVAAGALARYARDSPAALTWGCEDPIMKQLGCLVQISRVLQQSTTLHSTAWFEQCCVHTLLLLLLSLSQPLYCCAAGHAFVGVASDIKGVRAAIDMLCLLLSPHHCIIAVLLPTLACRRHQQNQGCSCSH
jgi:hypothetical protein